MNQKCLIQAFKCGRLWLMFLESSLLGCYTLRAILLNASPTTQQTDTFLKPYHLHWHICNYFCRRLTHWQWQFIGLSFPWWAKHQTMLLMVCFLENRFLIGADWNRSPRYLLLWVFVLDYLFQSWGGAFFIYCFCLHPGLHTLWLPNQAQPTSHEQWVVSRCLISHIFGNLRQDTDSLPKP